MRSRHLAVLASTVLAAAGCGVGVHVGEYRHKTTPPDARITTPVTLIDVTGDRGRVTITAGGTDVTIHRVIRYQGGTPRPGQRLDGGTLTLTDGCSRCSIEYDITAPPSAGVRVRTDSGAIRLSGVARADAGSDSGSVNVRDVKGGVTAHSDSGSVTVRNVQGDVTARSDSGALTVESAAGALNVRTSSGAIRTSGLRSTRARASSDSGAVRLDFDTAPGNVRATTGSGALHVHVPAGRYDIDADSDTGHPHISDLVNDPAAPAKLYLRTDSGGLTVDAA